MRRFFPSLLCAFGGGGKGGGGEHNRESISTQLGCGCYQRNLYVAQVNFFFI